MMRRVLAAALVGRNAALFPEQTFNADPGCDPRGLLLGEAPQRVATLARCAVKRDMVLVGNSAR